MDAAAADQQPAQEFVAYVPLPEQQEIEARVGFRNGSARVRSCGMRSEGASVRLLWCWFAPAELEPFGVQ